MSRRLSKESSDFYLNKTEVANGVRGKSLAFREEWRDSRSEDILMTVALPLKGMQKIVWLALESLRRQEEPSFPWELIVYDDNADSAKVVESFTGKLPGCSRIVYRSLIPKVEGRKVGRRELKGTIPLIDKWVAIGGEASPSSVGYVLQAGDVYSPPRMLINHFENFKDKECIYSTYPKGLFYDIGSKRSILYDGYESRAPAKHLVNMHLHMAVRTSALKLVRPSFAPKEKNKHIDAYIRRYISKELRIDERKEKVIYDVLKIDLEDWKYGLNTDGFNTISDRKSIYSDPTGFTPHNNIWQPCNPEQKRKHMYKEVKELLPSNVFQFLESLGGAAKK